MIFDTKVSYTNPEVRDLDWCIRSSNLMSQEANQFIPENSFWKDQHDHKWLQEIDANPSQLLDFLDFRKKRRRKLGLYFEDLTLFWLTYGSTYEVLNHDLQVQAESGTAGAFDFILRNQDQEIEHWELAVKFYLCTNNSEHWQDWVGPGRKDRLAKKLAKLFDSQINLSTSQAGCATLTSLEIPEVTHKRIMLKGVFFTPWNSTMLPQFAEQECNTGLWVEQAELPEYLSQFPFTYRWKKRDKPDWLSPTYCHRKETEDIRELANFTSARDIPFMVSILRGRQFYQEQVRLFIVPNGWFGT